MIESHHHNAGTNSDGDRILPYVLALLGILLLVAILGLGVLAFTVPITISGITYMIGGLVAAIGLILASRVHKFYIVMVMGLCIVFLTATIRFVLVQNEDIHFRVITLPQGKDVFWLNTLIDEQDLLVFGETLFHWIGGDSDSEHDGLGLAFRDVYAEMRKEGNYSSPVVSTYLNLQKPDRFDAVMIEPETEATFGVVFLHGYMGNVTAQCWVIAQAIEELGGVTVCPSTVWTGQWWLPEGQQILQSSFDYLTKRGIQNIYLGGFSNGGFSIGHLAPQLADQKTLRGLIFIDGFYGGKEVKELGLPVLILEGTQDTRVPVYTALQFAQEVGDLGTYVAIDSDHFLIIKEPALVTDAIASWLQQQLTRK